MAYTVGELAKLTGVTVRALHHYDEIGLVRPSQRNSAGHRLYDDRDALRLQQVMLFRELGLPLDEIAAAIDEAPSREELLRRHRDALIVKRGKLDQMLAAVDAALDTIEKGKPMQPEDFKHLFDGFDPTEYEAEARERWGETDAYKESARRTKTYGKADWERMKEEANAINQQLVACMNAGAPPDDPRTQAAVDAHRLHIDTWFYPCSKEMHKNLGAMYVADERFTKNLDKVAPGFARYLSEAIAAS
ncbi:MAG: MerR family transcriptional regulator [Kofleriaceae bacterium]|nr:MerR family transcriptional regulator [Kofleriaceae bacterium]